MARRPRQITVRMVGTPGLFAAEAIARWLIEREKVLSVPAPGDLRPVEASKPAGGKP